MKEKMMASLLVDSTMVGASLAPLSVQAVTTGSTPITTEFAGSTLPDGNGVPNTVDPDPTKPNSNFDLLFIPRECDFGKLSISDDLTKPIPNKIDEGHAGNVESAGVEDIREDKESWHVAAQSIGMKLGEESLGGSITAGAMFLYPLIYNEGTETYDYQSADFADPVAKSETVDTTASSIASGGDAMSLADATAEKGQGLWQFSSRSCLNITASAYNIRAGAYTGSIIWNLVAGPSV